MLAKNQFFSITQLKKTYYMVNLMLLMRKSSKHFNLLMRGTSSVRKWVKMAFTLMWAMLVANSLEARSKESLSQELSSRNLRFCF